MQAKAHVSVRGFPARRPMKGILQKLWRKVVGKFVMDAPEWWDVHPEVQRKLDEKKKKGTGHMVA